MIRNLGYKGILVNFRLWVCPIKSDRFDRFF